MSSPTSFSTELRASICDLNMLQHPFYADWMAGKLTLQQLRDYAHQYTPFVDAFPQFVSGVHNRCEDAAARRELFMNLQDEEGSSTHTSHPTLWKKFASELDRADVSPLSKDIREAAQKLKDQFLALSRSSYEEGLCALYAYEYQIPQISDLKIKGLIEQYGLSSQEVLGFFEVHKSADVFHSESCAKLIDQIPAEKREAAMKAARQASENLWGFLSEVHSREHAA